MTVAAQSPAARARQRTARVSIYAALFLVAVKLATGIATGSLAFLAEAVHSGTDLVAALLTFFAVRVAIRPPDREHQYGHGKAEHLAALGESAFLLLVSLFIAYESLRRLIDGGGGHDVDVTWWALTVLAVVIVVDASRALISFRTSRRYGSAALAANALHFTSDLAGSLAVLVGLLLVRAGEPAADAAAALFVAVLVVIAALRLAKNSVDVLMDRTVAEADERIRAALAEGEPGVEVRRVRVRHAGGRHFVDLVVGVPLDSGVAQAHTVADRIEDVVERSLGGADVVVHVEPAEAEGDVRERATAAAERDPRGARGAQRARDAAPAGPRAVAPREAPARPLARRGTRRGRAARGTRARGGAGAPEGAHPYRAAGADGLGEHASQRRHHN